MAFPKVTKTVDGTQIKIQEKYLVEKYELVLDRLKCVGCGQCSIVCPKEAIRFGPAAAVYENKPKDLNASVVDSIDPEKCVYCGTCTVFCPFDAIHLYKNDKKIPDERLEVNTEKALPKLESEEIFADNIKRKVKVYWDGEIDVTYEIPDKKSEFKQYYMNKCPGDCRKCEEICPTDAISFNDEDKAFETKDFIQVDDEKCIKCSACMLVCPQDNFKVKWTDIKTSGAYNAIFWDPIRKRLLDQEVKFSEEDQH